ncbi:hypothetical protein H1R20_g12597, partial [Candolleomyces eurysporus]
MCNTKGLSPDATSLPPLLKELLDHCTELLPSAFIEVEIGCCIQDSNLLYELVMQHPLLRVPRPLLPGVLADPSLNITGDSVAFTIPNFPERMLMLDQFEKIELPFVLHENLFILQFSVKDGEWIMNLDRKMCNVRKGIKVLYPHQYDLKMLKLGVVQPPGSKTTDSVLIALRKPVANIMTVVGGLDLSFLRQRNDYIGKSRELSGTLYLHVWVN